MRLTAKSEYGLIAAIDLAVAFGTGPVSAREIAERRDIPARFLDQLLVSLRRGEVVTAVRGAHGGFTLAREPEEITVLDIVQALEGPLEASLCDAERSAGCGRSGACAAAPVWSRATMALRSVFAETTLADLAGNQLRMDETRESLG